MTGPKKITREGRDLLVYDSGLEKDAKTGHITRPVDNVRFTQENASAMAKKRWDDYRPAIEDGAARGARRNNSVEAVGLIYERQTKLAIDDKRGRDSTTAAKFVVDGLGALPDRSAAAQDPGDGVTLSLGGAAWRHLLSKIADKYSDV